MTIFMSALHLQSVMRQVQRKNEENYVKSGIARAASAYAFDGHAVGEKGLDGQIWIFRKF